MKASAVEPTRTAWTPPCQRRARRAPNKVCGDPMVGKVKPVGRAGRSGGSDPSVAGGTNRCTPIASRSRPSTASAGRSANTILPASISNPPPRSAAASSKPNGSSATARTNCRSASSGSCRAGTLRTRRPSSATSRCARVGAWAARSSSSSACFDGGSNMPAAPLLPWWGQGSTPSSTCICSAGCCGCRSIISSATRPARRCTRWPRSTGSANF